MDFYNKIEINNFRSISHLELNNLSKVNLFVGKNNVGKSTTLESAFLLSGMSNPTLAESINRIRGLDDFTESKFIFHNFNLKSSPTFIGNMNSGAKRILTISPENEMLGNSSNSVPDNKIKKLKFSFSLQSDKSPESVKYNSFLEYKNKEQSGISGMSARIGELRIPKAYKEKLYAVYITENVGNVLPSKIAKLVREKKDEEIVTILKRAFNINIKKIAVLPNGIFFDIDEIDEMVSLALMGTGVQRFLNIIGSLENEKTSIFFIEEIENGLHYSIYKELWKYIFSLANLTNSQFFITTHSVEVMSCFKAVLEEMKECQDFARIISLENTKKMGLMAYDYTYEQFGAAIEKSIEIRG